MYRADIKNLASAIKDGSLLLKELSKDALNDTAAYRFYKYLVPSEGESPIIEDPVAYVRGNMYVADGIVLPKAMAGLLMRMHIEKEMMNSREFNFFKTLDMQSTIIKADNAESGE